MLTSTPAQFLTGRQWLLAYVGTSLTMATLDAMWIGLYMAPAYKSALGELMLDRPRLASAVAFYLLFAAGVVFLAVAPGLRAWSWQTATLNGAVLGLVAYATYDLTNYSILKVWPLDLALADIAWGSALSAASAGGGWFAATRWG